MKNEKIIKEEEEEEWIFLRRRRRRRGGSTIDGWSIIDFFFLVSSPIFIYLHSSYNKNINIYT